MRVFLLLFALATLNAEPSPKAAFKNPTFCEGTLETSEGGIVTAPEFRLQARKISITKGEEGSSVFANEAILLQFGDYYFTADTINFDFSKNQGELTSASTMIGSWYVKADQVLLNPDGSFDLISASVTSDESLPPFYAVGAESIHISRELHLDADKSFLHLIGIPKIPLPGFGVDLKSWGKNPLSFNFKWGGREGPKVGARLQLVDHENDRLFIRGDFRVSRGFGGGFETWHRSSDRNFYLETTNYIAQDSAILHPNQTIRYCFRGQSRANFGEGRNHFRGSWDKLSDIDMATDFEDAGMKLDYPGRTEAILSRQGDFTNLFIKGRLRVNSFQTVKQELPTFSTLLRPYRLDKSGILLSNEAKVSFLNFAYSKDSFRSHDFNSVRLLDTLRASRPFNFSSIRIVPTAGANLIFYGNSKEGGSRFLAAAYSEITASKTLYKNYGAFINSFTPYVKWQYLTYPSSAPNEHYIFDIEDGLYHLNATRLGVVQNIISLPSMTRPASIDLYSFVFVKSKAIPKMFLDATLFFFPSCKEVIETGYDLSEKTIDRLNIRHEWTMNSNLSLFVEYRQRSAYSYRKAAFDNFYLESYRSTRELLKSQVSDRRKTLLAGVFWRFHPRFALEWESRTGWDRRHEPSYFEFDINLLGHLTSHFLLKIAYQHREEDKRVAFYITLDPSYPARCNEENSSCLSLPFAF